MKRFTAFFAVFLTAALLAGCSGKTDTAAKTDNKTGTEAVTTTAAETENPLDDDVPELDFNGYVFKIIGHGDDNIARDLLAEEETGDLVNDARLSCFYSLNERFNISIENYIVSGASRAVYNSIMAGNTDFDAEAISIFDSIGFMAEKIFLKLDDLKYIDIEKPYWDSSLSNELSIMNDRYLLIGDMFTRTAEWTNIIMYNRDMMKQYNIADLTQLVKNNEWTLDKFTGIATNISADIDGDGEFTKNDRYGLAASDASIANIFFSSGLKITGKDENDRPYFVPFDSQMVRVLEKTLVLKKENNTSFIGAWDVIYDMFRDGRSLFYAEILAKMGGMRDVDTDIGILPYPKFDEKQERYLTTTADSLLVLSVPVTSSDPERTGAILEAYASAASQTIRPAYYDVTLTYKNLRNENDVEMLDIILDSIVYDIGYFHRFGGLGSIFSNQLSKGSETYASEYEKNFSKSETALNEWIAVFDNQNGG